MQLSRLCRFTSKSSNEPGPRCLTYKNVIVNDVSDESFTGGTEKEAN